MPVDDRVPGIVQYLEQLRDRYRAVVQADERCSVVKVPGSHGGQERKHVAEDGRELLQEETMDTEELPIYMVLLCGVDHKIAIRGIQSCVPRRGVHVASLRCPSEGAFAGLRGLEHQVERFCGSTSHDIASAVRTVESASLGHAIVMTLLITGYLSSILSYLPGCWA